MAYLWIAVAYMCNVVDTIQIRSSLLVKEVGTLAPDHADGFSIA
jgi:hypothetical protein